jgi:hypothetical protein
MSWFSCSIDALVLILRMTQLVGSHRSPRPSDNANSPWSSLRSCLQKHSCLHVFHAYSVLTCRLFCPISSVVREIIHFISLSSSGSDVRLSLRPWRPLSLSSQVCSKHAPAICTLIRVARFIVHSEHGDTHCKQQRLKENPPSSPQP